MKQITLSIPEPCHEGWDNMTPSEKGRFCSSCQKEVIDFTGMTDDEVFAFFAQKTQGSVCGRTHISQLDTPIAKPVVLKKKRFWYWQYAASLLFLFIKPGGAKAQVKPPITVTPPQPIRMGTVAYVQPVDPGYLIKGRVIDETGEPIASASVTVKGYSHGVVTDKEGNYQFRVKQKDIMIFSAVGYESQQIVVKEKDSFLTTVLKSKPQMLEGEIVVVGGLSWNNDDAIGYDVPRHKSLLQVKDKTNNTPLANASLTIMEDNGSKQKRVQTNREGTYLLRKIKANETYLVNISAKGYQTKNIRINGSELKSGNNAKTILLEKEVVVQTLEEVVVTGIKPPAKTSCHSPSINDALLGKVAGPIIYEFSPSVPTQQLQPKSDQLLPKLDQALQGKVGGIIAQPVAPAKPKTSFLKKIFSKPGASSNTPAPISIYPNPAKVNSPIVIAFETAPKGSYRLQLINSLGSLVQQQSITVPAEAFHFQWDLGSPITAGSYTVSVTDAEGKIRYTGKIILTQ